ncbi:MAG: hypothetical protein JNM57_00865 [Cyclobacteriaceae bacterium]|nr:hypothetical protein [Cyclobacteriaceae bacterium]
MLDIGLYILYALFVVAVVLAIVFPIIIAIKTPRALVRALVGIGFFVVLFGISYALSGSYVSVDNAARGVTGTMSKLIGAGFIMLYISLALSFLAIIYSEISKALK